MSEMKTPDLSGIPSKPGCYLIKDREGKILYIGKAINLRSRVLSYFRESANHAPRLALMVSLAEKVDFTVTKNEVEALILENILIKKEKPRFNILLRDDKTYPYLKVTTNEKYPRIFIVRRVVKDGAEYFGPYISAKSVRAVLRLIHKIFPVRQSRDSLDNAALRRPCLNYQMKRCLAPCAGKVTPEEYKQMIASVIALIKGRDRDVVETLKREMVEMSNREEFEKAALLRDQLQAIERLQEKQKIDAASESIDEDYIATAVGEGGGVVRIMMVRGGKLKGDQNFTFRKVDDAAELTGAFMEQFYSASFSVPGSIFVNVEPADSEVIARWLSGMKKGKVEIVQPQRGRKKELLKMAVENAKLKLATFSSSEESLKETLGEIQRLTGMVGWPAIMECVDISNTSGISAVGSLVTFFNGEPDKKAYKRYSISTPGPDDYAMMAEVVERRFRRLKDEGGKFPDILVIDGGPGQLNIASETAKKYNPDQIVIGIAKGKERENEETDKFYLAGRSEPLPIPPTSPARFMLQRLRDESHRFAVNYHRKKRSAEAFKSGVDEVKGFGPKRKKLLIKEFGSLKAARGASVNEIARALSVSEKLAAEILENL
ncbi:MAG: excinuclease ABC subunit UvrC [Nitrospinota bacterium]|nr:excinuclease ABC subunit UvrC [Nitrospinota bacterium]